MTRNPDSSVLSPTGGKSAAAVLRRDGEQWTVGYQGRLFRLKDKKGLDYLATLLRHPGKEFHAFDLMTGGSGAASGKPPLERMGADRLEELGLSKVTVEDAGAMLDVEAKASYRRQLGELREELEEAKALGKVERGEQIEA